MKSMSYFIGSMILVMTELRASLVDAAISKERKILDRMGKIFLA